MKDYTVLVLLCFVTLSGCATCRNHPIACSVATAVIAGSIAASVQHHHDQDQARDRSGPPCVEIRGVCTP